MTCFVFGQAKYQSDTAKLNRQNSLSPTEQKRKKFQDAKRDLIARLSKLGTHVDESELVEDVADSVTEFLETQRQLQAKNDMQAYETYEKVWSVVLGVESIEILTGATRIAVIIQGLDLMDLLPQPSSIATAREKLTRKPSLSPTRV